MELLNKLLSNMPILKSLNGNKTVIGALSLIVWIVVNKYPAMEPVLMQLLGWLGVTLLPIGLAHKAIK